MYDDEAYLFYTGLKEDIARGPNGARARMGTLQDDLFKLKELSNNNMLKIENECPLRSHCGH
jgi:hypothetical protein